MLSFSIQTLTEKELRQLIAGADDSYHNQIRVKKDGTLYVSRLVGSKETEELQFRYETLDPGNNYVGTDAAYDDSYIQNLYKSLKNDWDTGRTGYLDY